MKETLQQLSSWVKNTSYNPFLNRDIQKQLDRIDEPLQLMIAGVFSSGKSTFINALIGEELLSSSHRAETAIITKLTYGEEKRLIAHYKGRRSTRVLPLEWMPSLTTDREGGGTALKPYIHSIEIQLPIEVLKYIHIIDSPGVNANEEHNRISESNFETIDAAIWLFFYESGGNTIEKDFIQKLKKHHIPVYGIINHVDDLMEVIDEEEEAELNEMIEKVGQDIQVRSDCKFENKPIGITAYHALEAKKNNNREDLSLSNWPAVDQLMEDIKEDDSIKAGRQYHLLSIVLQSLNQPLKEKEKSLPIEEFTIFVNQFITTEASSFYPFCQEKSEEIEKIDTILRQWKELSDRNITDVPGLHKFGEELAELYSNSPHLQPVLESLRTEIQQSWQNLVGKLKEWEAKVLHYNLNKEAVDSMLTDLETEWKRLEIRKWTGIGQLQGFRKKDEEYGQSVRRVEKEYESVQVLKSNLSKSIRSFNSDISRFFDEVFKKFYNQQKVLTSDLQQFISDYREKYSGLTEESVENLYRYGNDINSLETILSPSFLVGNTEAMNTHAFEYAFIQYDQLVSGEWRKQLSVSNKLDFLEFNNATKHSRRTDEYRKGRKHPKVNEKSLLGPSVKRVLPAAKFNFNMVSNRIKQNRKRLLSVSLLAALVVLLLQVDIWTKVSTGMASYIESNTEETVAYTPESDWEEVQPDIVAVEEAPIEPVTVEEPSTEPESEPVFIPHNEVAAFMETYRDQYFYALNQKDFSYVSSFLQPGSQAFDSLEKYIDQGLPEVYLFSDEEIEVTAVSEVIAGEFTVETEEEFIYTEADGDRLHYLKTKRYIVQLEGDTLTISQIFTDTDSHTVEELTTVELVSRNEIITFMEGFKEEKLYAIHSGTIDTLRYYLNPAGSLLAAMEKGISQYYAEGTQLVIDNFYVHNIIEEDARNYLADVEVNQKVSTADGIVTYVEKIEQYRISVDPDGSLTIMDRIKEEVISKEELIINESVPEDDVESLEESARNKKRMEE